MKHKLLKHVVLVLVFFSLLGVLQGKVISMRDPWARMHGFYQEPQNSLDVVFLGASHMIQGVNPLLLWEKTGVPSYVLAQPDQPMWMTFRYLEELCKTQSPRVVFLETRYLQLFNGQGIRQYDDSSPGVDAMRPSTTRFMAAWEAFPPENLVKYSLFPIVNYHTFWKKWLRDGMERLAGYDPSLPPEEQVLFTKGFRAYFENIPFDASAMRDAQLDIGQSSPGPLHGANLTYLDRIVSKAEAEGIRIVFLRIPYPQADSDEARWYMEASIEAYALEHHISYLNYAQTPERIGINWAEDLQDPEHLNHLGAEKVTTFLADFLLENMDRLDLTDRRMQPEYDGWNRDAATYALRAVERLREMESPYEERVQ